ncbi:hypothetical protein B0H10DRAFT_1975569 [Mycena sp. CBHHK59/15]|nr:hypothetical protein B0H10DRAFT_1975569 [Mycena sp. CBHHK59/15]
MIYATHPRSNSQSASTQSATFLRLRSNELIGVTPSLTFHSTPFPNLTSLVLESICFDSQDSAGCPESFILLHTDHLTRLVLIDCPLYGYDKVWAVVLANLGGNMRALRELSLGNVTLESVGDNSLQYAYEDMAVGRCRS